MLLRKNKVIFKLVKGIRILISNKGKLYVLGFLGGLPINLRLFKNSHISCIKSQYNVLNIYFSKYIVTGFYKKLILSIYGVSFGWVMELALVGRGLNVFISNNFLKFNIGFSHSISFKIPKDIIIKCGKGYIFIFGISIEHVKNLAYLLRNLRPVDNYKGQGIKYKKEMVILKPGKQQKN